MVDVDEAAKSLLETAQEAARYDGEGNLLPKEVEQHSIFSTLAHLGSGSWGDVYRARSVVKSGTDDAGPEYDVAVKVRVAFLARRYCWPWR
jgi:hypothetical protein